MKNTKSPFPDVELERETVGIDVGHTVVNIEQFEPHWVTQSDWENRKQRRAGVATFSDPDSGLRRRLLEQRQRRSHGTLDVKLRRLQRARLRKG